MRMKMDLEKIRNPFALPISPGKVVSNKIGCNELMRFHLKGNNQLLCKIYKRTRYVDDSKTRKVHDYKIKVVQECEPKSFDYIVLRRLPRSLEKIQPYVNKYLHVKLNKRIVPHPILYIQLQYQDRIISSQRFYDLEDSRFSMQFGTKYWFSQRSEKNE
jgi:predicted phosphatase